MPSKSDVVSVELSREDTQRVYELVVARAVQVEASEEVAMCGFGSSNFRRPADALRAALDA